MNAAGGAFGVLIGVLLTEYANWRRVMFVNVPMAACALALAWRGVPADPPPVHSGRPGVLGAVLATVLSVALPMLSGALRASESDLQWLGAPDADP
jgi:predicted MFS family arabinose efflux permease